MSIPLSFFYQKNSKKVLFPIRLHGSRWREKLLFTGTCFLEVKMVYYKIYFHNLFEVIFEESRNSRYLFYRRFLRQKPTGTVRSLPLCDSRAAVISVLSSWYFRKHWSRQLLFFKSLLFTAHFTARSAGCAWFFWWCAFFIRSHNRQTKLPAAEKNVFSGIAGYSVRQSEFHHCDSIKLQIFFKKLWSYLFSTHPMPFCPCRSRNWCLIFPAEFQQHQFL